MNVPVPAMPLAVTFAVVMPAAARVVMLVLVSMLMSMLRTRIDQRRVKLALDGDGRLARCPRFLDRKPHQLCRQPDVFDVTEIVPAKHP